MSDIRRVLREDDGQASNEMEVARGCRFAAFVSSYDRHTYSKDEDEKTRSGS